MRVPPVPSAHVQASAAPGDGHPGSGSDPPSQAVANRTSDTNTSEVQSLEIIASPPSGTKLSTTCQVASCRVVATLPARAESRAVPSKHRGAESGDEAFLDAAMRLGSNVRRLREATDLSQEQLSEAAGCAVRHIQRIEAGKVNASLRLLVALASAMDVDLGALLAPPPPATRRVAANKGRRRRGKSSSKA